MTKPPALSYFAALYCIHWEFYAALRFLILRLRIVYSPHPVHYYFFFRTFNKSLGVDWLGESLWVFSKKSLGFQVLAVNLGGLSKTWVIAIHLHSHRQVARQQNSTGPVDGGKEVGSTLFGLLQMLFVSFIQPSILEGFSFLHY